VPAGGAGVTRREEWPCAGCGIRWRASLDGYIAAADDGFDWIAHDPDIDFVALAAEYDTLVMGRRTYEAAGGMLPRMRTLVCSRTMHAEEHPGVEIVADDVVARVRELKAEPGRDIWLYGGGELFRTLLEGGCVDSVEPAVVPVLLGGGVPLLPAPASQQRLRLASHHLYAKSGIMLLRYDVVA
jgi:dihydrofolate reductase